MKTLGLDRPDEPPELRSVLFGHQRDLVLGSDVVLVGREWSRVDLVVLQFLLVVVLVFHAIKFGHLVVGADDAHKPPIVFLEELFRARTDGVDVGSQR